MESFILRLWSKVFDGLGWVSPFRLVRVLVPRTKGSYGFVDAWVLGNLVSSLVCLVASSAPGCRWWEIAILWYGGIRIFEAVVYLINVVLLGEYRAETTGRRYAILSSSRSVLLALHNYVEILFWFALFYRNLHCLFDSTHISLDSLGGSLYFSLVTMSTLGYGDVVPTETVGLFLTCAQTSIGIFIAVLVLGSFISLLRVPRTPDESEK